MSVSKRDGSPYYYYRFMLDGCLYRGSTGETQPYKARQFEIAKIAALRRGEEMPGVRKVPRLSEFSTEFLAFIKDSVEAGHLKHSTRRAYEYGCRSLSKTHIWNFRVNRITTEDAIRLKFPGSASNANQALRALRRMLTHAKTKKLIAAPPTIKLLEELGRETVVEPWVEDLLLEFARSPLREIIVIMLDSFMRPGEVCQIQWGDIHWQQNAVFIPFGKTKRARRFVGLTDRMRNELRLRQQLNEAKKENERSPWVFPSKRAKCGHLIPTSLSNMWAETVEKVREAIKQRRLPPFPEGLVLYSCRHTGATNYLDGVGGNIKKVSDALGHASTRITERYLHPSIADAAEVMNRHNRSKLQLIKKETA